MMARGRLKMCRGVTDCGSVVESKVLCIFFSSCFYIFSNNIKNVTQYCLDFHIVLNVFWGFFFLEARSKMIE